MADIIRIGNKQDKWSIQVSELINWLNENKQGLLVEGNNITLTPNADGTVTIDAIGGGKDSPIIGNTDISQIADGTLTGAVAALDVDKADKTETGYELGLSIDETTYVMTIQLKNKQGTVISAKTIDFPIESMVIGASYADGYLTLSLQNGQTLDSIDISDIVAGLVKNTLTIAGIDLKDNITTEELINALGISDKLDKTGNASNTTATFVPETARTNIVSGEKLSVIFGKIIKWFADLKDIAFSGSYNDLTSKPSIPAAVAVKGSTETTYRTGNVNLTADNVGALSVKQLTNENLNDIKTPNLYYGAGSNNVKNKPDGIDYFGLIVVKLAGTWFLQTLYGYKSSRIRRYSRWLNGSTQVWSDWTEEVQDDSKRPISEAQQTALDKKLSLSGGMMIGRLNMYQGVAFSFLQDSGKDDCRYRMYVSNSGTMRFEYLVPESENVNILTCSGSKDSNGNVSCDSVFYGKLGTKNVGNSKHPIYLDGGNPAACQFESNTHAANVYITESGNMYYSTASSKRFKNSISPLTQEDISAEKLYDIDVVQYKYNTNYVDPTDSRYDTLVPGFIAEDVYDKYPIAADYHVDENGKTVVDDWNFRYMIPAMLKLIQDQKKEINELKKNFVK